MLKISNKKHDSQTKSQTKNIYCYTDGSVIPVLKFLSKSPLKELINIEKKKKKNSCILPDDCSNLTAQVFHRLTRDSLDR